MTPLVVAFTVYGEPRPAGSKRAFTNPRTGRPIVTDDAGKSGKAWRRDVQLAALAAWGGERQDAQTLLGGPLAVRMTFYRRRPKGHYGRAGTIVPSAPLFPTTKPDVLKLARAVEDALTGLLWRDDALVVVQMIAKVYGEPERVEVVVSEAVDDAFEAE